MKRTLTTLTALTLSAILSTALACPIQPGKIANGVLKYPARSVPQCGRAFESFRAKVLPAAQRSFPEANLKHLEAVELPRGWDGEDLGLMLAAQLRAGGWRLVASDMNRDRTVTTFLFSNGSSRIILQVVTGDDLSTMLLSLTNF